MAMPLDRRSPISRLGGTGKARGCKRAHSCAGRRIVRATKRRRRIAKNTILNDCGGGKTHRSVAVVFIRNRRTSSSRRSSDCVSAQIRALIKALSLGLNIGKLQYRFRRDFGMGSAETVVEVSLKSVERGVRSWPVHLRRLDLSPLFG
jgi:hypothetical protein